MSKLKDLAILEKVIQNDSDKIEEIDIYSTQKENITKISNWDDFIWMHLNLNVNLNEVNN